MGRACETREGAVFMVTLDSDGQSSVVDRRAAVVEDTRAKITKYGWSVVGVFPTAEGDGVPFAYTVGLTAKQLPELAIYGLHSRVSHPVLNAAARQMVEAGAPLVSGQRVKGVLAGGVELAAVEMTDRTEDLSMVRQVYGSLGAAVQLCWPDVDGLFPWEQGSSISTGEQPVCGMAPSGRRVYGATRVPVESAQELAELVAGVPKGELTTVDPQADNERRAGWGAQALIGYATYMGKTSLEDELETTATDMLADLRHMFDAVGLDWDECLCAADVNYREEILGEP